MKNINFSPLAKTDFRKGLRSKILILFEGLVFFAFLVMILWHKQIDLHQDQILVKEFTEESTPFHSESTKSRTLEFSDKEEEISIIRETNTQNKVDEIHAQETDIQIMEDEETDTVRAEEIKPEKPDLEPDQLREPPPTSYYLKVFSGVIKKDVKKVADYLAGIHFLPRIIREPGFSYMNNVYVSRDSSLSIKEMLDRLKKDGFSGFVLEDPQKEYHIRISSCYYKESAEDVLENLKSKGYFVNIVEERISVKLYSIFLGQYPDFMKVLQAQKQLTLMGFPATIIITDFPSLQ